MLKPWPVSCGVRPVLQPTPAVSAAGRTAGAARSEQVNPAALPHPFASNLCASQNQRCYRALQVSVFLSVSVCGLMAVHLCHPFPELLRQSASTISCGNY